MNFKERTALITGASRGIGREIALCLAEKGMNVIVNYNTNVQGADEVVSIIKKKGGKALTLQADVSVYSEVSQMVERGIKAFSSIDALVNNAGVHIGGKVQNLSLENWDKVIKVSLYGTFNCCRCVVPNMIEQKFGCIINISAAVGERGYPGDTAYAAAKAGLIGFSKSLAREVAHHGITVNVVTPGFVDTDMTRALSEKVIVNLKTSIPLGRLCKGKDVAEMVAFLVDKGDNITGSIFHVDGGLTM
jgi:3-oxoacyl-[acyl-carrier protein] reductase